MMNWLLMRPMRTAPTGPFQGISEIITAAEAALTARMSIGFSPSIESENMITWTSLRRSLGKSGRSGRSVRRAVRIASSEGRPSRRKNEPGILPPAYIRSSYSTLRGKKSMPSRTSDMVAAAKTIVSPRRTVTAPPAWDASLPVSKVTWRVLSPVPRTAWNCFVSGFIKSPNHSIFPPGQGLKGGGESHGWCRNHLSIPDQQRG